jgi:hypothetical protein
LANQINLAENEGNDIIYHTDMQNEFRTGAVGLSPDGQCQTLKSVVICVI